MNELIEDGFDFPRQLVCPLCAKSANLAVRTPERPYYLCDTCDLIFVPEQWHMSEDAQRDRYAKHKNTMDNAGYVKLLGQFIQQFQTHVPPRCRVLDIGCGPNKVLVNLLCAAGYEIVGQDPLYGISGLENSPFDAVISTEAIEHFSEPRLEFNRMAHALRDGGTLALTTRFHRGAHTIPTWWYARDPTHVSFYSHTTMSWIARHFGLHIVAMDDERFCAMRKLASAHSSP